MMQKSELVERAIEILAEYGWVQDSYRRVDQNRGGFCLMGAGIAALKGVWPHSECEYVSLTVLEELQVALAVSPNEPSPSVITNFNDHVLQSKEEAIQHLMTTAKYWRDKGQ